MNSRSSSRPSYRNVLIAAGLAAALGGQNADGGLDGTAASHRKGHEDAMSPAASETSSAGSENALLRRIQAL
jgi:hypothetical protein